MADRVPGPVCTSRLGDDWIDQGTLCRTRTSARGPLGVVMSLVMGAKPSTPEAAAAALEAENKRVMAADISYIAKTPFGKSPKGAEIVTLLRSLNSRGEVKFGGTIEGARGDWDGTTIRVNEEYKERFFPTVLELVHEGAHAWFRTKHKKKLAGEELRQEQIADELQAQGEQLDFYVYLKAHKGCPEISLLELRLGRRANGSLRSTIEQNIGGE